MNDRYQTALQAIVDFEPSSIQWEHPEPKCENCARARARKWPPSQLCDPHYSSLVDTTKVNERARNNQHWNLKEIASKALQEVDDV